MEAHPYILGTGDAELDRLAHQHEVWREPTVALWDAAGFGRGHRIVDLACGPGFATFDLAERVGTEGHVTALDNSQRFLDLVSTWVSERSATHITPRLGNAYDPDLPSASADGVFIRWLLCFLPETGQVIEAAARLLAPGGRLVVIDYVNYLAIRLYPESRPFHHVFTQVHRSFADSGGDLDVGSKLPRLMSAAGLDVKLVRPLCVLARPDEPVWRWVRGFQKTYLPGLVEQGYLTAEGLDDFERDWLEHEQDPTSLFFAPPMLGVVAVRPE